MLQAFSSGKIAQLVGCSKGEGGKPASKQAQPGFDFPKRCLWILTLWSSSIKFHPKLSGGINHVSLVDVKLETLVRIIIEIQTILLAQF